MTAVTEEYGRKRRRRRRGLVIGIVVLVVLIAAAVIAFVVGDGIFRQRAEQQIEQSVDASLPDGVEGRFDATIGGGSALLQWLHGSFEDVTLTSRDLAIAGASADATVHLTGLPVDGGDVERATARLSVSQSAFDDLPALRQVNASNPVFGNGTVSTTVRVTLPDVPILSTILDQDPVRVRVVLRPTLSGQTVRLVPSSATLLAGPASVPATAIVQQLLPNGVSVCAATYLPRPVRLDSIRVKGGEAIATLSATDVDPTRLDAKRVGSCG